MELQHKQKMTEKLDAYINARSFDGRAVFLFGHCNATEQMADYLLSYNINPSAVLDNNVSKQGLFYREIPILPPEFVKSYNADNSIVLIATRFYEDMSAQLKQRGYNGEIVQVVEYDSFTEYSVSDQTLERKTERMRRGVKTLEKIRTQYPEQHLIICPYNTLGDVYWAMSFLPAYCEKNAITETVAVVVGNVNKQVAEIFGMKNIISLDNTKMDEFVQAYIFTREKNGVIAHHDRPYTDSIIKYLDKSFLSFIDYYKCAVYGLSDKTKAVPPTNNEPFRDYEKIPEGKSVIISPKAKSVTEIPAFFWEQLVSKYKKRGYEVYTNITDEELPVCGTLPLSIPIKQVISAAEHAGVFIGIRSGLCDVLNTAKCRKTVVFPDCCYSTTSHKVADFFSLPDWDSIVYY